MTISGQSHLAELSPFDRAPGAAQEGAPWELGAEYENGGEGRTGRLRRIIDSVVDRAVPFGVSVVGFGTLATGAALAEAAPAHAANDAPPTVTSAPPKMTAYIEQGCIDKAAQRPFQYGDVDDFQAKKTARGNCVEQIQRALVMKGVDGNFGSGTVDTLKNLFQPRCGIPADGKADDDVLRYLQDRSRCPTGYKLDSQGRVLPTVAPTLPKSNNNDRPASIVITPAPPTTEPRPRAGEDSDKAPEPGDDGVCEGDDAIPCALIGAGAAAVVGTVGAIAVVTGGGPGRRGNVKVFFV